MLTKKNSNKGGHLPKYRFHFNKGDTVEGEGETSYEAFIAAGCSGGAMQDVVSYEIIDGTEQTNPQHRGMPWEDSFWE
jgi:hypothetical protein